LLQTDAVLGMALRRLTSLEAGKLQEEADSLKSTITGLEQLLANEKLVLDTVKRESQEITDKFGDERRTTVSAHTLL
jgi:DNA gyrase subunit A